MPAERGHHHSRGPRLSPLTATRPAVPKTKEGCIPCRYRKKKCKNSLTGGPCQDCAKFNLECGGFGVARVGGRDHANAGRELLREWVKSSGTRKPNAPPCPMQTYALVTISWEALAKTVRHPPHGILDLNPFLPIEDRSASNSAAGYTFPFHEAAPPHFEGGIHVHQASQEHRLHVDNLPRLSVDRFGDLSPIYDDFFDLQALQRPNPAHLNPLMIPDVDGYSEEELSVITPHTPLPLQGYPAIPAASVESNRHDFEQSSLSYFASMSPHRSLQSSIQTADDTSKVWEPGQFGLHAHLPYNWPPAP